MIIRLALLLFLSLINPFSKGYTQQQDSLAGKSYEELYDLIDQQKGKPEVGPYLKAYLAKAKLEDNPQELINGYNNYLYEVEPNQMLVYADSMIYAAERTDSNELIGSALLTKGIVYYNRKEHIKALDLYLIANRLIATTNNEYLRFKTQYNIAHIKYYLGFYNEALSLYRVCTEFFKDDNSRAYLNCLHSTALCHTKLGNYQESTENIQLAIRESNRLKDVTMLPFLYHAEGINEYFRRSYTSAIAKITSSVAELERQKDFGNLSVGYFYIASALWDMGKKELALPYLLKVNRIFMDKKYIRPDLRRNYEMLIDYFRAKGDSGNELMYISRLLQADKLLNTNYRYLSGKVFKEYDTTELVEAKHQIELKFKRERQLKITALIVAAILLPLSIVLLYRNRQLTQYKKNFERYKDNMPVAAIAQSAKVQRPAIPEELEQNLLSKLDRFESTHGYIKKDLKIDKLAITFGTNYKYLSQVINYHRGKKYPDYISDLRIAYIIKRLEDEPVIRQYTFTAIAGEAGFGTAQQFTDVFRKKMGMPFSFFLNRLSVEE